MADIQDTSAALPVKLVGADAAGLEQTPVQSTSSGGLHSNLRNNAGTEIGTTANPVVVRPGDGADLGAVTSNGDLKVVDGVRNGGVFGSISTTTANTAIEARVGASRLANRKVIQITCLGTNCFWGLDNTVSSVNGTPIANNQTITFVIDPESTFQVWLVSTGTNRNFRIVEIP